jgi:serine protease SohB
LIIISAIASLAFKHKKERGHIRIKHLNDVYLLMEEALRHAIGNKQEWKDLTKKAKERAKDVKHARKKRLFVMRFDGDLRAHAVESLREEVTAILTVATTDDEVVICLESPGGVVHGYGLAASQLARFKARGIKLTAAIDKVAASGGYLMAVVADKIVAAPFAIIGSIGVAVEIPNFHRLLEKMHVDYEQLTAGEFKRTLSLMGPNTSKGRAKMQEEVDETHGVFKAFVSINRPQLNVDQIATGEHWLGKKALELKLVDELSTSDDYLYHAAQEADVFEVSYSARRSWSEKIMGNAARLWSQVGAKRSEMLFLSRDT